MRAAPVPVARLAEKVPAILLHLDSELRILFASGHCQHLLGYAPREMRGRALAEVLDSGTLRYVRTHIAALKRGHAGARDYVLRHRDGSRRYCQVHAVLERDARGRSLGYFACASDDATGRAARQALRRAQRRLGAAVDGMLDLLAANMERVRGRQRARRKYVARAEHELRTPLASIVASLELLREGRRTGATPSGDPFIGTALENADRLTRLVEQMMEIERIDLGVAPPRAVKVDLRVLVAAALAGVGAEAQRCGVRAMRAPGRGKLWTRADPARLAQVLDDVLRHAIACTPAGGTLQVGLRLRGRTATMEISGAQTVAEGGGLVFCNAKAVVTQLGGFLEHAGEPGQGAAIRIGLPRFAARSGA